MSRTALLAALSAALLLGLASSFGLCLQDDAFISFRYARNLVDGYGLVFNPGEPVEGYTNFLWTLLIAGTMALGASPLLWVPLLGVATALGALVVAWVFTPHDRPAGWLAPSFVALNLGLIMEAVQGLETALVALWVGLALALRAREEPGDVPWSAAVAGLAALTRPEGYLLFGLLEGLGTLWDRRWRHRLRAWGLFAGLALPHLAFRVLYYGDIVPNTFHAKVGHSPDQVRRGLAYLADFALANPSLALLALAGVAVTLRRRGSRRDVLLPGLVLPWLAYVVAVGGDFKPTWRFVVPLLLPLSWLAAEGLAALPGAGSARGAALWVLLAAAGLGADTARAWPGFAREAALRREVMDDHLLAGAFLRENFPPDAVLAIHAAGAVPYASGLYTIDMWGLSDPHIARREIEGMGSGTAGHEKTDYSYVFSRSPDIYLPHSGYLSDRPQQLLIPADFPPDFELRYTQRSVPYRGRWVNLYTLNEGAPPPRGSSPQRPDP